MLPQFEVRGKGQSKIALGRVNEPCGTFSRSEVALKIKKAGKWLDAGVIGGAAIEVMCAEPPDVKSRLPQRSIRAASSRRMWRRSRAPLRKTSSSVQWENSLRYASI